MSDYRATNQITNHEEVRDCVLDELSGSARADEVAAELVISKTTARRYLEQMVERGWATRGNTHGPEGTFRAIEYTVDPASQSESW